MLMKESFSIIDLVPMKIGFEVAPEVFVPGRTFCSISFRLSGQIVVTGNQQTYPVTPQSIFYMPSGYDYSTKVTQAGEMYVIHFTALGDCPKEPFVWKPQEPWLYEKLFCHIMDAFPAGQRKDFTTMGLAYGLLARIREDSKTERAYIPRRMLEAKGKIHEKFNESTLSVTELARDTGLSEVYFRREFKACFGSQPAAYISSVRIEHAKALLETGEHSISEVAIQSGYDNVSYFSYRFRCMTGVTPSQYRDNAAQKNRDGL